MVTRLSVEWMPSGSREPLTSLRDISLSGGPSHTFRMSWDASVSKARNWRLKRERERLGYSEIWLLSHSKRIEVDDFSILFAPDGLGADNLFVLLEALISAEKRFQSVIVDQRLLYNLVPAVEILIVTIKYNYIQIILNLFT